MLRIRPAAVLSLVLLATGPARAQAPDAPQPPDVIAPPGPEAARPPASEVPLPKPLAEPYDAAARAADDLLGRLAKAEDPRTAKRIAAAVQALWTRSGSDTVDLLVARSTEAQRAQKLDVAIKLMDEVVGMKPDYAEGWNRRATLKYVVKDFDEAMGDIHETLIREPRHYGAWIGLGRILSDAGLDAKALGAYRKALEIYPAVEGLKKQVGDLALKVEGQPI